MSKNVAFFGLGAMGEPMAENLLRAGFKVRTAVHRSRAATERLAGKYGLALLGDPASAAEGADFVITILPADREVHAFLTAPEFLSSLRPDAVTIDMSSCASQTIRQVEQVYAARGLSLVDAPVSGGVQGAADGTLTIFASGSADALERSQALFQTMGGEIFHLGPCGNGKAFKNINNLLSMYNIMGIAEAVRIARCQGLDLDLLYQVLSKSSADSASLRNRWGRITQGRYEGGFKLRLARKDIGNALALGEGVPLPMTRLLYELLLTRRDCDELDAGVMYELFGGGET